MDREGHDARIGVDLAQAPDVVLVHLVLRQRRRVAHRVDLHLDAHLKEHVLHHLAGLRVLRPVRGDVEERQALPVLLANAAGARLPARRVEQRLGLHRAEPVGLLDPLPVAPGLRGQHAVPGPTDAEEEHVDQLLLVDRVLDGLADPLVVERRLGHVELE